MQSIRKTFKFNLILNVIDYFAASDGRLVARVQLQMSASWLFAQSNSDEDGEPLLVVLYQQIHRIRWHGESQITLLKLYYRNLPFSYNLLFSNWLHVVSGLPKVFIFSKKNFEKSYYTF